MIFIFPSHLLYFWNMETQKMEYLKLIQDVITRMANNSFALKGWAITLVVGLFGISVVNNAGIGFYCIIYMMLGSKP